MSFKLRSVNLKLIRAEEHLHTLKTEVALFREIEPYEVIEDRDSDPDALIVTIRPRYWGQARWSVIFGDFIQNLRSALDLLAHQLVKAAGNTPIEEGYRKTQFPILSQRPDTKKGQPDGKAEIWGGVTEDAATLVDALQPYTWDEPSLHPLAILAELSNKDKHRRLNAILSFIPYVETSFETGDLEALIRKVHPQPIIVESELRLPYEGSFTREVEVNFHFTPFVLAGEPWKEEGTGDAIAFASYLFEFVCQKVVDRFRRVCFPKEPPIHLATPLSVSPRRRSQEEA